MAKIDNIGTFGAKVLGAEWKETETKPDGTGGKPQVGIRFEIFSSEVLPPGVNRQITGYFLLDPNTKVGELTQAERTVQTLVDCGARLKDGDLLDLEGVTTNEMDILLAWNDFNGERRPQVAFANRRGVVFGGKPLSEDKGKKMSVEMRGLVNKVRADMAKNRPSEVGGLPVGADGKANF